MATCFGISLLRLRAGHRAIRFGGPAWGRLPASSDMQACSWVYSWALQGPGARAGARHARPPRGGGSCGNTRRRTCQSLVVFAREPCRFSEFCPPCGDASTSRGKSSSNSSSGSSGGVVFVVVVLSSGRGGGTPQREWGLWWWRSFPRGPWRYVAVLRVVAGSGGQVEVQVVWGLQEL